MADRNSKRKRRSAVDDTRRPSAAGRLRGLANEASGCTACSLWRNATQTVFGEGAATARIVLVGEQPGDADDREGRPFVGPAGRILDQALKAVGSDRSAVYVTNAVKHFKWESRGKRRIHKTPAQREIEACGPWLEAELAALRPAVVVCLGATAARALLGRDAKVGALRGKLINRGVDLPPALVTFHPSYLLRLHGSDRAGAFEGFVHDLRQAARMAGPR